MNHWRGRDPARAAKRCAQRAIAAYEAWGATRKANALRDECQSSGRILMLR